MKKKFIAPVVQTVKMQSEHILESSSPVSAPSLSVNRSGATTDIMYSKTRSNINWD